MHTVLAIDTSTDACSVGLATPTASVEVHRIIPKAHNKHILQMIDELLGDMPPSSVDLFACGVGPGSFTGLRIAASVTQGLAWALEKPVAPFCSLECQAQAFLSEHPNAQGLLLSCTDAQIGEVYWRWFECSKGQLTAVTEPGMSLPEELKSPSALPSAYIVGSGCHYVAAMSSGVIGADTQCFSSVRPHGGIMAAKIQANIQPKHWCAPQDLTPRYIQQDIGWKKLSEQPRRV